MAAHAAGPQILELVSQLFDLTNGHGQLLLLLVENAANRLEVGQYGVLVAVQALLLLLLLLLLGAGGSTSSQRAQFSKLHLLSLDLNNIAFF
jgi:hypothetical protein